MSASLKKYSSENDELDLRDLFLALWRGKWLIIAAAVVSLIVASFISFTMPDEYEADALLAPNQDQQGSGLSGLSSQFSGLASLAGLSLGSSSQIDKTTLALQILKSRKFISNFIEKHKMLVDLIAAEEWDKKSAVIKYDKEKYDEKSQKLIVKPGTKPDSLLNRITDKFINKNLEVQQDSKTGMITISVTFLSPILAQEWVTWLVADINEYMRLQDMKDSEAAISYLNNKLKTVSLADSRSVLYQLIEQKTNTLMLTNITKEYVLKTIDPAIVPDKPSRNGKIVIPALGLFFGIFLGCFIVGIRSVFHERKNS